MIKSSTKESKNQITSSDGVPTFTPQNTKLDANTIIKPNFCLLSRAITVSPLLFVLFWKCVGQNRILAKILLNFFAPIKISNWAHLIGEKNFEDLRKEINIFCVQKSKGDKQKGAQGEHK